MVQVDSLSILLILLSDLHIYRRVSVHLISVLEKDDFKVEVMRSSGPGGQSVNTANSAVRLTHIPTGKCSTHKCSEK